MKSHLVEVMHHETSQEQTEEQSLISNRLDRPVEYC